MKSRMAIIVFFSIVLLIHIGVNYYIFKHTKPIFDFGTWQGISFKIIFFLLVLSYPVGRILERMVPSITAELIAKIGAFWLGAMLYLTLMFLVFDVLKLIFSLTGFTSFLSAKENISIIRKISLGIYASTAIILIAGFLNALYPKVSKISIKTDKSLNGYTNLKIVAASDIHLGTIISNGRLERFVRMMNEQKADIMLLAGDIFDEDLGPVIKNDMGKLLSQLNAPLGVFAVTGNHEYIGGVDPAIKYLEEHGITVVRDTVKTLNDLLNIVGRDDRQAKVMGGINRKPIEKLVKNTNKDLFTIMLDHQPYNLHEAVENGIDLQISGHTHHGQMFPLNLITNAMFEVSRGHKQIENTHIYVSTGFGTWGPPVRVGNRPEIVVIEVTSQMD